MIWVASLRRVITWSAIVGYGLVVSGLPLPLGVEPPVSSPAAKRLAGKDHSTPFPCMDKPCGCATAEHCFTSCCCHSPAETLAWARARGVEPAVIAALQRRVAAAPARADSSSCSTGKSCCDAAVSKRTANNAPRFDLDGPEICSEYRSFAAAGPRQADNEEASEPSDEPLSPRFISLRAMLACGGIVAQWSAIGTSLPPPPAVTCEQSAEPAGEVACHDESFLFERAAPDAPPPRV